MAREQLNISNLTEGMVVKNYKIMCDLLGQSIRMGQSKQSQLKSWERYFTYDKQGQKFIITKIFDTPLPDNDMRRFRGGKYAKYIEVLLLRYLMLCDNQTVNITQRQLYCLLGLVSPVYNGCGYTTIVNIQKKIDSAHRHEIRESDIKYFCQKLESKLYATIRAALTSMRRKKLIDYVSEYVITTNDGKIYEANADEARLIEQIHESVLVEMGCTTKASVLMSERFGEFYHKCNLKFQNYNWQNVYQQLHIVYMSNAIKTDSSMEIERIRLMGSSEIVTLLNQAFAESVYKKIASTHEKYNNEEEKSNFIYTDDFADKQKYLTDCIVKLNKTDIKSVADRIDHLW